eukprot:CAMPEP_0113537468 /NCGR_PEP_ID=MMETSP0015_2-20120614/6842_1 /TAXON_ID=2838 /ORGANISM="Odontella" /LENGTH=364 /DNA_ID=CAMNT_0000436965 /DNA_START=532 /DNA_END=1627 /DNA_ORIENTATION=+ /assembly_acc=CAM_ASM_000160
MSNAQFSFQDDSPVVGASRKQRGGTADTTTTDNSSVAGSLTYSATSSVQSGGSAAGESTDSSFADILKAIDNNDAEDTELATLTAKVGVSSSGVGPPTQIEAGAGALAAAGRNGSYKNPHSTHHRGMSMNSVASSLQYSVDGESYAAGADGGQQQVHPAVLAQQQRQRQVPQTITGQPSDSKAPDLGGLGGGGDNDGQIRFSPAHQDSAQQQRRSSRGQQSPRRHQQQQHGSQSSRQQGHEGRRHRHHRGSDSSVGSAGSSRSRGSSSRRSRGGGGGSSSPGAPPPPYRQRSSGSLGGEERSDGASASGTPPTSPPPRSRRRELEALQGGNRREGTEISDPSASGKETWYSQWWMCGFSDALGK